MCSYAYAIQTRREMPSHHIPPPRGVTSRLLCGGKKKKKSGAGGDLGEGEEQVVGGDEADDESEPSVCVTPDRFLLPVTLSEWRRVRVCVGGCQRGHGSARPAADLQWW